MEYYEPLDMETGLWLASMIVNLTLELCNTLLLQRRLEHLPVPSAILIATLHPHHAPKASPLALFFIVLLFLVQLTTQPAKKAILSIIPPAFAYAVTLTALTVWRLHYFGYPFPNTYYAKVSASIGQNIYRGLVYIHTLLLRIPAGRVYLRAGSRRHHLSPFEMETRRPTRIHDPQRQSPGLTP